MPAVGSVGGNGIPTEIWAEALKHLEDTGSGAEPVTKRIGSGWQYLIRLVG